MHSVDSVRTVFHPPRGTFQLRTTYTMSPSHAAWQQLISAIHASGRKAALAITGGGSGAVGELLRVPGGSRLLIEAQVPYDALALATFLGFAPAQACSSDTAIAMAQSIQEGGDRPRNVRRSQAGAGGHRSGRSRRNGSTGERSPAQGRASISHRVRQLCPHRALHRRDGQGPA